MYYPSDPVEKLTGVGEKIARKLKYENIKTIGDLINYFPFRHEDLSKISTVKEVEEGEKIVLKGEFEDITTFKTRTRKLMIKAKFRDDTGSIEVTWFNSPFILNQIKEGETYLITTKPSKYRGKLNIVNPQINKSNKTNINTGRIVPIYFTIKGIYPSKLRKLMLETVNNLQINDFLEDLEGFFELKQAYKEIHFPTSLENIEKAKNRIALNELIHVKLHAKKQKNIKKQQTTGFTIKQSYKDEIIKTLPFDLTKDQEKSVKAVIKQLKNNTPMNILLSGDVGSGKTIVSIIASHDVLKNGGKTVYIAPTVVLANQVYEEYTKFLGDKAKIQLHTSVKKSKNKDWDILIGTHALLNIEGISEKADFTVIDEQHKFGVKQRAKLIEDDNPPHVLTMTATPIPRSLALAFFEELDVLQIKTKPKGRKKVITKVITERKRKDCYRWLKEEVIKNQKVIYIVPFIEKSKAENFEEIKSIEEMKPKILKEFGKEKVSILHGKMKDEEKEDVINKFKQKKGGILLSTQVVEVGVDIKEATVIIIESSERFGLASLHQLRGRVGRNNLQSYCFLFPSETRKKDTLRLKHMEKEHNGFNLAQLDLENRGGGEIFGLRQSGDIDLKFVDFSKTDIIKKASEIADQIYKDKIKLKEYSENYFTREFFFIQDN